MAKGQRGPRRVAVADGREAGWGADIFAGVAAWPEKQPEKKAKKDSKDEEETASVDIWHWRDTDAMPKQKKSVKQDKRKNMLAVWHVDRKTFVQLGHDLTGQVTPLKHQNLAYATEWKAYAMDRSIGRPALAAAICFTCRTTTTGLSIPPRTPSSTSRRM